MSYENVRHVLRHLKMKIVFSHANNCQYRVSPRAFFFTANIEQ